MEVLRAMPSWSWEEYKKALARRGYSIYERKDKKDVIREYAILKGNTKYKASEPGVARNLMISKLPRIWQKIQYRERLVAQVNTSQSHRPEPVQRPAGDMDYTHYRSIVPARCPTRFLPMTERDSVSISRNGYLTTSTKSLTTGELPTAVI